MNQRTRPFRLALALTILIAGVAGASSNQEEFHQLLGDYEAIRLALLNDTMDGVGEHAESLARKVASHLEHLVSDGKEPMSEDAKTYQAALEAIGEATSALADAQDISSARTTMFELTKPMVQLRQLAGDEGTLVAYCSMAKKAWLQADGTLGNPYYGQSMPACGEVVSQ